MRRGLGRGRLLVAIGSVVVVVASFLPWYTIGGAALPALTGNAFDGAGIVVFLAAAACLALLVLPYAEPDDQPLDLDRPFIFALVAVIGAIGLVLRLVQLQGMRALGLPDRALGLWLAAAGLALIAWGVAEMSSEGRAA